MLALEVKAVLRFEMAICVAASASPEAAFWREKFLAAICSTREVERKETVMVASSAVIRRTRMRALPESDGGTEGLTTIERRGRREKEQPKVGPKAEGAGATESKRTEERKSALSDEPLAALKLLWKSILTDQKRAVQD